MDVKNGNLSLIIDMKMMVEVWHIVELQDEMLKVIWFNSEVSFETGGQNFNGDFNYLTLVKKN